jgi:subtilisin-like proprotein convertase family protein
MRRSTAFGFTWIQILRSRRHFIGRNNIDFVKLKTTFLTILLAAVFLAGANLRAQVVTTNFYSQTVNATIPDENPNGYNTAISVSNIVGTISGLTVFLNITNGFNGDLYAWLDNPSGTQAILLNRVGVNSGNAFGYEDSGFDISLNLFATNDIHFYQTLSYTLNSGGQLTGTWASDGRNIDPGSSPSMFDSAAQTEMLNQFLNTDPNGDWTIFLADLNGGFESTLVDWALQIETVPEPSSIALFGTFGTAAFIFLRRRRING